MCFPAVSPACVSYAAAGDCRFYRCFQQRFPCDVFGSSHVTDFEFQLCKDLDTQSVMFDSQVHIFPSCMIYFTNFHLQTAIIFISVVILSRNRTTTHASSLLWRLTRNYESIPRDKYTLTFQTWSILKIRIVCIICLASVFVTGRS